jgi:hypothetical protein
MLRCEFTFFIRQNHLRFLSYFRLRILINKVMPSAKQAVKQAQIKDYCRAVAMFKLRNAEPTTMQLAL